MRASRTINTPPTDIVSVRKRQGRSVQTRADIIAAAKCEFAAKGFGGATTRSIADRAKIRHGLLVYHFESKLGLWNLVMDQVIRNWHDELIGAVNLHPEDEVEALRGFLRRFIELSADDPDAHLLMPHESRDPANELSADLLDLTSQDMAGVSTLIRKSQESGRFVKGDPAHLFLLLIGAASRPFMINREMVQQTGYQVFEPTFVEAHFRLYESLFFLPSTAR